MVIWIGIVDTQQNVFFFSLNASLSQLRLFTRPGPAGDAVVSAHNEHCSITYPWGKESEPSSIPPRLTGFPPAHQNKKRRPLSPWSRLMNIWDTRRRCCLLDRLARRREVQWLRRRFQKRKRNFAPHFIYFFPPYCLHLRCTLDFVWGLIIAGWLPACSCQMEFADC